eukprot:SAG31_NODE_1446_length_8318_cov_8.573914_9_plen_151_part_00
MLLSYPQCNEKVLLPQRILVRLAAVHLYDQTAETQQFARLATDFQAPFAVAAGQLKWWPTVLLSILFLQSGAVLSRQLWRVHPWHLLLFELSHLMTLGQQPRVSLSCPALALPLQPDAQKVVAAGLSVAPFPFFLGLIAVNLSMQTKSST